MTEVEIRTGGEGKYKDANICSLQDMCLQSWNKK